MNASVATLVLTEILEELKPCHILRPLGYYLITVWILGTLLNGAALCLVVCEKKSRNSSTNILIGGLILSDFIGSSLGTPFPALSMIACRYHLLNSSTQWMHFRLDGSSLGSDVQSDHLLPSSLAVQTCTCFASYPSIGDDQQV